eukprot:scaffold41014_cov33-Tisochrysis_lutea.AAC.2
MPSAELATLCVGPNPALQRVLSFPSLKLGEVNRAAALTSYCGGKGQGAALAALRWAPEGRHAVAQFLGGDSGRFCEEQLQAAGLETITQKVTGPTRICTTLLNQADGSNTELIDPSDPVTAEEVAGLVDAITTQLSDFAVISLCGTQPPGSEALYERLAAALLRPPPGPASAQEPILLLDGFKAVDGVLHSSRLDVLKINRDELIALTEQPTVEEAATFLLRGSEARLTRPNAVIAVTDGPRPAMLFRQTEAWKLSVPEVPCLNPIGAGDVCTGVFAHQLAAGDDALEAFAWGLAAASARVVKRDPTFDPIRVRELYAAVKKEPIETWNGTA